MDLGALTNCLDRAAEVDALLGNLPVSPVIPLEKLIYGVSLRSIDQIISFDRIDPGLVITASGLLDLSIARVPMAGRNGTGLGMTLGQRWVRGFLDDIKTLAAPSGGEHASRKSAADSAVAALLLFHLELLACVEAASARPGQSAGERATWSEIQKRVTGIWRDFYDTLSGDSYREVSLGRGEGEIWKVLMAYYLPEVHDLMVRARAGAGPEDIRVHLVTVEGFEVKDFGGLFFDKSLSKDWDAAKETVEFEGHSHQVRITVSDRVVGTSKFSDFLERIMALPEPIMRLKAFFSMILEYSAFGGGSEH